MKAKTSGDIHKNAFLRKRKLYLLLLFVVVMLAGFSVYNVNAPAILAQQAFLSLPQAILPQQGQKVLVFSPHPDDETIAAGGYIEESCAREANVRIVLVTNGNKHGKEAARYSEFEKATGLLGVPEKDLVFLGFSDGSVARIDESVLGKSLKQQLDLFNPDIVIFPDPSDFHPDHSAIGRAMVQILENDRKPGETAYEYLVHYGFFYPRPKKLAPGSYWLPPRCLVKSSDWQRVMLSGTAENLKKEAIFAYQSQLNDELLRGLLLSSVRKDEVFRVLFQGPA